MSASDYKRVHQLCLDHIQKVRLTASKARPMKNTVSMLLLLLTCSVLANETNSYNMPNTYNIQMSAIRGRYERVAGTNVGYLTCNDFLMLETNRAHETRWPDFYEIVVYPCQFEDLRTNREYLPAGEFSEGNWAESFLGCQLSLRFTKPVYTNGEPVMAVLLVRNVTNQVVDLRALQHPMGGPVHFHVVSEAGSILPEREFHPVYFGSSGSSRPILPGTQWKFRENLNEGYTLQPGTYTVQAFIAIPMEEDKLVDGKWVRSPRKEVTSAKVTIRIE